MEPLACAVTAHGLRPVHARPQVLLLLDVPRVRPLFAAGPVSPGGSAPRPACTRTRRPSTGASAVTVSVDASVLPDVARSALHEWPQSSRASIGTNKPRYTFLQPPTDRLTPLGNVVVALDLYNIRDRGCVVGAV
ncbi:unnamed protein product [Macrosiphum euphorbiae]|uniref:Uncharacterized protein n=1 Tax=Macrosiphum euphorbiae TaxID=13131 RepID=A0AAV0Y614_9HEMI|nr:unnamed protein product [Macrosiphum euphorbiae]